MSKKKRSVPHTYVIIFAIIVFCAILTWIIPGGEYVEKTVATDGVKQTTLEFRYIDNQPQTWQVLTSFVRGFTRQAKIIVFILVIGGAFWIVNSTRAIDTGILSFLRRTKRMENNRFLRKVGVNNIVIVSIMLMFSIFGAVFGMSEETIAFVAILIPLSISMGYDSIVGVCMVYVAAHVGFAGAVLNPFTIGIAQGMADLPLFSGIEYRLFCWLVINVITIAIVLRYAKKVKKGPTKSIMYEEDSYWREKTSGEAESIEYVKPKSAMVSYILTLIALTIFSCYYPESTLTIGDSTTTVTVPFLIPIITIIFGIIGFLSLRKSVHFFILTLFAFTIVFLVVGVMGYKWYLDELCALFLALGLLSGIAVGLSANNIAKQLIEGAKDIMSAALVVGLAGGIIVILEDGKIINTILYSLSQAMNEAGRVASVGVMYGIQTLINIVIPSGSAKAALTMPIMAPFSDLIGVSRQATVMAFQFGDGFTNMITPTSGVLIAVLGIARIQYGKWLRWIWPLMLILIILGFLLLIPTVTMDINGF
ncbi:MAG: AbgT family transporter [Prevotellaceae bacterium]|jgi:uncharacterized ion transporter superfamily protein YfcC|nr:AbgT family transporter [Prevotellaceae bacterium]